MSKRITILTLHGFFLSFFLIFFFFSEDCYGQNAIISEIEEVIVEIDSVLSSGAKETIDQLELEDLQRELDKLIKENYDDDELKRDLEKLRDDVSDYASQLEKEINNVDVDMNLNIDVSEVEEDLSRAWDDLKRNIDSLYTKAQEKTKYPENRSESSTKDMKAEYIVAFQKFNGKIEDLNLYNIKKDKETLNNYGRNLRHNDANKTNKEASLPPKNGGVTKGDVNFKIHDSSSKKSLYPEYYNFDSQNALWNEEEYEIVKEYRKLMGFRLIGSALHDAAYSTSQKRWKNQGNSNKNYNIMHEASSKGYMDMNTNDNTNDRTSISPRDRINAYFSAKLKETLFQELEKRIAEGSFSEAELKEIITKISSCIPHDENQSNLDARSILSTFLHVDVSANEIDNSLKDISKDSPNNIDETALHFSSSDMIRMVKILLPSDVKESLAKLEIQLVKSGLIELPPNDDGNINKNPTPEEIETAILIALKQLSILTLKLQQINLAEAIDGATELLVKMQMMKEANPNAQAISFDPDMSKWEILVQLDELKEANKAYYGPDTPFGSRSFEVELRNSSVLIAIGNMKGEGNGLPPFKTQQLAENYYNIIYDNSIDLDELKYLSKQLLTLGDVYELTDIGRLMLAIQDYYGVTSFDQINNKVYTHNNYGN